MYEKMWENVYWDVAISMGMCQQTVIYNLRSCFCQEVFFQFTNSAELWSKGVDSWINLNLLVLFPAVGTLLVVGFIADGQDMIYGPKVWYAWRTNTLLEIKNTTWEAIAYTSTWDCKLVCCDGAKFPRSIKSARYQLVGVAAKGNGGVLIIKKFAVVPQWGPPLKTVFIS